MIFSFLPLYLLKFCVLPILIVDQLSLIIFRIEAVRILRNGLPQTEMLCLDLIPKILYDEDIALHRTIIDLCTALVTNGRNQELKELLIKFLEVSQIVFIIIIASN